jgi:titin
LEARLVPTTYVVTSAADDGSLYTLRWALGQVNAGSGGDEIDFQISPLNTWQTISLAQTLPPILQSVTINGLTQGGGLAPCVEINGHGTNGPGLESDAPNVVLEGLAIDRVNGDGILLNNPAGQPGDAVVACHVGTDLAGTASGIGNTGNGITILGANNTITRNPGGGPGQVVSLISGNGQNGVDIKGANATGNTLFLNDIGLDASGNSLPNGKAGVLIEAGASGNQIGLSSAGAGNVISGNSGDGVRIDGSTGNNVANNVIGLTTDGSGAVPNSGNGVVITNGASGTDVAGDFISGNTGDGVLIDGAGDTTVENCFVGLNQAGTAAVPQINGIRVTGNKVGQVILNRNDLAGNTLNGILLSGPGVVGTKITGCTIGTNPAGDKAIPNQKSGVAIVDAVNTTVGQSGAGLGNLISGNTENGVSVRGQGTIIQGNRIGTNMAGTAAIGNSDGIKLTTNATSNTRI